MNVVAQCCCCLALGVGGPAGRGGNGRVIHSVEHECSNNAFKR